MSVVQNRGPLCLSLWLVEWFQLPVGTVHTVHFKPGLWDSWTSWLTPQNWLQRASWSPVLISSLTRAQALGMSTASSASLGLVLSPLPQDQHGQGSVMALAMWVCEETPQDSPLALSPHDMLSALAFSWGPTTHGSERSTNVTLAPWKSKKQLGYYQTMSLPDVSLPVNTARMFSVLWWLLSFLCHTLYQADMSQTKNGLPPQRTIFNLKMCDYRPADGRAIVPWKMSPGLHMVK